MKMKKKKRIFPIIRNVAIFFAIFVITMLMYSRCFSVGRYLEARNGIRMFVLDESPIQMINRTDDALFEKLDTGDMILVVHDGIYESYPGMTDVYNVFKLKNGSIDDISQSVISSLVETGWIGEEGKGRK